MSGISAANASAGDDCGCCAGTAPETPATVLNRPGLSAIAYRVGTHASFKASMLARLNQLPGLATRDDGDFTIALLDAWATTADVLTFYQERIANESYLRTATERSSLAHLGELIGYQPRPGVAASTYLAFTLTAAPGAPAQAAAPVQIGAGARVQSIPGAGELPQTFETLAPIPARVEWNALRPSLSRPQPVSVRVPTLLFEGVSTGLKAGDSILIVPTAPGSSPALRTVASVEAQPAAQKTQVLLFPPTTATPPPPPPPARGRRHLPERRYARELDSMLRSQDDEFRIPVFDGADVYIYARMKGFSAKSIFNSLRAFSPPSAPSVFALRSKASLFGHNAPEPRALSAGNMQFGSAIAGNEWVVQLDAANAFGQQALDLDAVYSRVVPSSSSGNAWAALTLGDQWVVAHVDAVRENGVAQYALSGKVTRVTLTPVAANSSPSSLTIRSYADLRGVSVLAESVALTLARLPRSEEPVGPGAQLDLDGWVEDLYVGQKLFVSGELDASRGNFASEVVEIGRVAQIIDAEGSTRLTLAIGLSNAYVRDTVVINGNVALASHGETVQEVLGSGDGSQQNLAFTLRQKPVTYTSDALAGGVRSSLELRIHGLLWKELPSLYGAGGNERVYATRTNDDGSTTVLFGDGVSGARPATASENIRASYRKGLGQAGNVSAGRLSLMAARPLGVSAVTNPLPATGAADPESASDIRLNAALTTRTVDRIVSLSDYEDFARAFGGIAKALASWSFHGQVRGVFLTVAGVDGAAVNDDSPLRPHLLGAITSSAEAHVPIRLSSYRAVFFTLAATLYVDPSQEMAAVLSDAEQRLRDHFSFAARDFGQAVSLGEVVAFLQSVDGVVAVEVTALQKSSLLPVLLQAQAAGSELLDLPVASQNLTLLVDPVASLLTAALPEVAQDASLLGAELLMLDPRPLKLVGVFA